MADDLLASVTNKALSDNSKGVKVLSLDEMKEVKGGYLNSFKLLNNNELIAFAKPDWLTEIGLYQDKDEKYYYFNRQGILLVGGMCGIDTT